MVHHLIKRCRVCGDQAPGFNFSGLSCDSCKAFFRRNAHRDFQCVNGGKTAGGRCTVNMITRKRCKACRLFKCLHVAGMKKELIFNSDDNSDYQQQSSSPDSPESHHHPQSLGRCLASTSLQLYEQSQLHLVEYAFGAYFDESNLQIVGQLRTPSEILNLPGEYIVATIRFCKRLPAFRSLPPGDQLILFKCFFPEKNSVRVSYKYDHRIDGWTGVRDYQNAQQGVLVTMEQMRPWACEELVSVFGSFIQKLHQEMEDDVKIRNLIIVSLLFKPRPDLSRAEPIKFHHLFYCFLLSRYLEAKYASKSLARRKYNSLRLLLGKIEYIAAILKSIYQQVPAETLVETLQEVYNLR